MITTLSFGQGAAMQLYQALLPFSFFFCVVGIVISAAKRVDVHGWLKTVTLTAVIAGATVGYPEAIQTIVQSMDDLRHSINYDKAYENVWSEDLNQSPRPAFYDVANCIGYYTAKFAQFAGRLSTMLILWLQGIAVNGLIAVSPLLLGMLALEWTQSIGINFLMTSFGVILWSVGIAIVDVTLANLATPMLAAGGITGGIGSAVAAAGTTAGAWVIAGGVLLGLFIVSNAMYLAVPFAVGGLMKGANPLLAGAMAGGGMSAAAIEGTIKTGLAQKLGSALETGANALKQGIETGGGQAPSSRAMNPAPMPVLAYPAANAGVPLGEERIGGFTGSRTKNGQSSEPKAALVASSAPSENTSNRTSLQSGELTSDPVPSIARSVSPETAFRQNIMSQYSRKNTLAAIDAKQVQGGS